MSDERRTEGEPHDRLTRICNVMSTAFEKHPEHRESDRCVIFLNSESRGGLVMVGYDDDAEALANVFGHLRAVFRANGKDLLFAPMPQAGGDRQ
jgi:hypothetical protein